MSASDYYPLVFDGRTLVKTLRQVYGAKPELATPLYTRGQVADQVGRIHPERLTVEVQSRRRETADTTTLVLAPVEGDLPSWTPGQYVNVFVEVEGVATSRPMSISSVSGDQLELTVRRKPGGFVSGVLAHGLQVGEHLQISGPDGDFSYMPVRDGKDLVLIAAGSGITPFMGMAEQILADHPAVEINLLYGSRSPTEIIFHQRLLELTRRRPKLRLHLSVTQPEPGWEGGRGRIDEVAISRAVGSDLAGKTFFVCGPPAMERDTVARLRELNVARGKIRVEASGPAEEASRQTSWPQDVDRGHTFQVHLDGREMPILARADEPLMNAMERAHIPIPAQCRSGTCGACRTKLVHGQVVRSTGFSMRPSDQQEQYIHACVSHPVSDLTLVVQPDIGERRLRLPSLSLNDLALTAVSSVDETSTVAKAGAEANAPVRSTGETRSGTPWLKSALALAVLGLLIYLVLSSWISQEMLPSAKQLQPVVGDLLQGDPHQFHRMDNSGGGR